MDQDIGLLGREVRKSRCWASQAELVLIIGAEGSYGGVYYSQTAAADRACCLRHRHSELRCWKYSIFSCHSRFNRVCGGPQYNGVSEYSIAIAATCFALFVPSGCGYDSHGGKPESTARIDTPAERGNNKYLRCFVGPDRKRHCPADLWYHRAFIWGCKAGDTVRSGIFSHQIGNFFSAWLGGICLTATGNYTFIWLADVALSIMAAAVSFKIQGTGDRN